MRHRKKGRKLNRKSSHRMAMLSNLAIALITHEQIKTTLAKAKELRSFVERLVTKSRIGSASNSILFSKLGHRPAVNKLIDILGERYKARDGGYTRVVKSGVRYGDCAPMAYIEFVDRNIDAKGTLLS